jgi:formylglycine-generating enzyme
MAANTSAPKTSFANVLRSFQTGGVTYGDFLAHVDRQLAAGALPLDLLDILRRRELIEPLPEPVRDELIRLITSFTTLSTEVEVVEAVEVEPEAEPAREPPAEPGLAPTLQQESEPVAEATRQPAPALRPTAEPITVPVTKPVPVAARTPEPLTEPFILLEPEPELPPLLAQAPEPDAPEPEWLPYTASEPVLEADQEPEPEVEVEIEIEPEVEVEVELSEAMRESRAAPEPVVPEAAPPAAPAEAMLEPMVSGDPLIMEAVIAPQEMAAPPAVQREDDTIPLGNLDVGARLASSPRTVWPRTVWKKGVMGLGAAVILAGWFYFHRSANIAPPAADETAPVSVPRVEPAGSVLHDCPVCPSMTVLPKGRFKQGSANDDPRSLPFEKPQHVVLIRYPFVMSTNEVTVGEFRQFITETGRDMQGCDTYDGAWRRQPAASWTNPGFAQGATHPVTCVSWNDAVAYAQWLSTKSGHRYRLPSASEWEYAARAGSDAAQPWGANGSDACANANVADRSAARRYRGWKVFACKDGYVNTAPVGSFKANAFGLTDMLGNVFEWTEDCWHDNYVKAPIDGSARRDGDCTEHELRGGSWFSSPAYVRDSYRNHFAADYRSSSVGVRVVRDMTP